MVAGPCRTLSGLGSAGGLWARPGFGRGGLLFIRGTMTDFLGAAKYYCGLGWRVIQIAGSGDRKAPIARGWQKLSMPDAGTLEEWFANGCYNIGIATGAGSGLMVLDVDLKSEGDVSLERLETEYEPLPPTPTVITGGGGRHYYFKHPGGRVSNAAGLSDTLPGLDLRGDGGQVVAPPSLHKLDTTYQWAPGRWPDDVAVAEVPAWLRQLLHELGKWRMEEDGPKPGAKPEGKPGRWPAYSLKALAEECSYVAAAAKGERNAQLNRSAFALGQLVAGGELDKDNVAAALLEAAAACGLVDDDGEAAAVKTIESGFQGASGQPRTAPGAPPGVLDNSLLLDCTDAGNAIILCKLFGDRLRWDHGLSKWLVWQGHWWATDVDGEPWRLAEEAASARLASAYKLEETQAKRVAKWATNSLMSAKVEAALKSAKSKHPIADRGGCWDLARHTLGVANGVIDLPSGTLRDGTKEDRIATHTPVAYDVGAKAPRWERFIREIFNDNENLIEFVRLAVGYSLTGDQREQVFFILHGTGANGKSVFLATLHHVLGAYAYDPGLTTFEAPGKGTAPHPEALAALAGKRFVTASETSEKTKLYEQRLKVLSHGDTTSARQLYEERFQFEPQCKIWLGLNHRPRISDDSRGFWRSVRLIPFERQFTGENADQDLLKRMKLEAPGVLRWAVDAARDWYTNGLPACSEVEAATKEYETEQDPLSAFLAERCVEESGVKIPASELYRNYLIWTEKESLQKYEVLSSRGFGRRMKVRYMASLDGTKRTRVYEGVRLLTTEDTNAHSENDS